MNCIQSNLFLNGIYSLPFIEAIRVPYNLKTNCCIKFALNFDLFSFCKMQSGHLKFLRFAIYLNDSEVRFVPSNFQHSLKHQTNN
jgi:hypothetical protein